MTQIAKESKILKPQRGIESHLLPEGGHRFLAGIIAEGCHGRIARQDPHDHKDQGQYYEEDGDTLQNSASDELKHTSPFQAEFTASPFPGDAVNANRKVWTDCGNA
jgi:hypothetical protein